MTFLQFLGYISFVVGGISILESIVFIVKYVSFPRKDRIRKISLIPVIICGIFLSLFGVFLGIFACYESVRIYLMSNYIQAFFWYWGQFICYCHLLDTLLIMVNNTRYAMSRISFIGLIWLMILYFVNCCMLSYISIVDIRFIFLNDTDSDDILEKIDERYHTHLSFKGISLVFGISIAILFLIIFFIQLCNIGKNVYSKFNNDITNISDKGSFDITDVITVKQDFEDGKEIVFSKASKVIILSIIVLMVTLIVYITSLFSWIFENRLSHIIFIFAKLFHLIIVPLSLYMEFNFMNSWYKCCCNKCNNCVKQCFHENMDKQLCKDNHYQLLERY